MVITPSWVQVGIMVANGGAQYGRADERRYPEDYAMRYLLAHKECFEIPPTTTRDEIRGWFEARLTRSGPASDEVRTLALEALADEYLNSHKLRMPSWGSDQSITSWPWPEASPH